MNPRKAKAPRKGSATVEFAVALPLLVLLIFGSLEACNMIFLKQALTEAAYQGAMVAMRPGATETEVNQRINNILTSRGIASTSIVLAGGSFNSVAANDTFTVQVSGNCSANQIGPSMVMTLSTIDSTVTALKM